MKLVRILQASAFAAAGLFSSVNVSAEEPAVAPAAQQPSDEQVFEAFGYLNGQGIAERIEGMAKQLELSDAERKAVLKGFMAALSGEADKFSPEVFAPEIQRVLGGRQQAAMGKAAEKAKGESEAYFAELKKNPAVKSTPSGLHYEVVAEGKGAKPKPSDVVKVHYTGKLTDGTVFDSSVQRGEPAEFPLGGVIAGWTEGLQLVAPGGKLKLYIPSELGYGEQGAGGMIPPNATLVFDVELLEIKGGATE
jgi:FKBP-type peptidyl-prolyl cis-trans isomerase